MNQRLALQLLFCCLAASSAQAIDLFWDGGNTDILVDGDGSSTGGAGTWDTTILNWDAGVAPHVAWNNGNNDTALFGGTAGTVTLGTNINVSGLEFTVGGYTIAGGGNTITLGNNGGVRGTNTPGSSLYTTTGTTTINANINNNGFLFTTAGPGAATISGVISGSGGFTAHTGSNVTLSGDNTYTGKTSITSDTTTGSVLTVSSLNSVVGGTASSSLGAPTTVANGTILIGASGKRASCKLVYTGSGETTDRVVRLEFNSSSSQTIDASGSGLLKFTSAFTSNATTQTGKFILQGSGNGEITQGLPAIATGGLQKGGSGTWTVGGASSINAVTVSGGTLVNDGQFNVTTSVTVSNGASLTAGYMTAASMTLGATSNLNIDLGGTILGTEYDNVTLSGAMAYGGNLSIADVGAFDIDAASQVYDLFNIASTSGDFGSVSVNGFSLTNTGGTWSAVNGDSTYTFVQSTGDLTVTVVPEPTSIALFAFGSLALLRRRR